VTPTQTPVWAEHLSSVQHVAIAHTPLALAVLACWAVLLGFGARAMANGAIARPIAIFLAGTLAFNLLLHLVYGPETFLFAIHFIPILTIIAVLALKGGLHRAWLRLLVVAAIGFGMAHNGAAFTELVAWHNHLPPPPPNPW
jgi:hypothetical protein